MPNNPFESQAQVRRLWDYLDTLARKASDREGIPFHQKQAVNSAAGKFYSELLSATSDLPPNDPPRQVEPPLGQKADNQSWSQFSRIELVDMLAREDVRSVADAFVKAVPLLRALETNGHPNYVFRGHRDISWKLLPRKGRALFQNGNTLPSDEDVVSDNRLTKVLSEEMEVLSVFQDGWSNNINVDELDRLRELSNDNAEWWFRMQHYDSGDGTRLLDVTTPLTSALLFACVNWSTGEIADNTDGTIYLWAAGTNANVDDFLIRNLPSNSAELFTGYSDAPRFWQEPPYGGPHYLRVPSEAKRAIVRDLLCMGFGPKDAVRGKQGLLNEQLLRSQVGLPGWQPKYL